ncbi:hypothetical protein K501DRAFT_271211 [Backusella circina FSU 941]|nr:hypothetical protein K501DRAFT_271211 [Backusella circina FSU 941]
MRQGVHPNIKFNNLTRNIIQSSSSASVYFKLLAHIGDKRLEFSSFKIDYKIGCMIKDKFMTLSCVEVGRFVNDKKVRNDHHMLLLEGKVIINNIIKNFQFIDPKSIYILNLQICGMKGDFIETILGNKKEYIAHLPLNRLRAPLYCNDDSAIRTFLRKLVYYRDHLENLSYGINQMINENDDKRASFGKTLDVNDFKPPNFSDWIYDNSVDVKICLSNNSMLNELLTFALVTCVDTITLRYWFTTLSSRLFFNGLQLLL